MQPTWRMSFTTPHRWSVEIRPALRLRFVPPIVANGMVYVPTADELDVYGLLSSVQDTGFEQVQVGAGQFQYRPTGSPWTFAGSSGISGNNSGFTAGNPARTPRGPCRLPPGHRIVQPDGHWL